MPSIFEQSIRTLSLLAVETHVECFVESLAELRCKRRFEYMKVVPFSRCITALRISLRDYQVAIQSTMITLPSLSCHSPSFPFPLFLASSAPSKLHVVFLITSDLSRHSVPPRHLLEYDIKLPHTRCVHRL